MADTPVTSNPEHDPMTIDPSNLGSVDPLSVEGLFLVALAKQGDARAAFLAETCADTEQRQRVEALLAAYENAGSFLEKPAITLEPTPVVEFLAPCSVPGTLGQLGPYEILEEIGRGGMGVVFRAHDPKLQRIVAVKALAPELARLPSARQRFLREARAAAAISHPHVVTIFAVDGTEEASLGAERTTLPYLVMECIVGQTLHDKIKRVGALKTEEIVRISRQIAEGLTAAHKRGLIHRDIKPANILLENGVERVKITDFGLARTASDGGITHTGEILGTPQCMSPEQARGELVDTRSDLFSLGCVMYTMCTGVNPFRADNMLAVMKKVCEATPRPIAELNPEIPEWLGQLVHQLLEKQADGRVQTAGEVVQVLESRVANPTVQRLANPSDIEYGAQPLDGFSHHTKFSHSMPEIAVFSALAGLLFCATVSSGSANPVAIVLWIGMMVWGGLAIFRSVLGGNWPWFRWSSFGASGCALLAGGVAGQLIRTNPNEQGFGMFVFGSAIAIFWLLTRLMPLVFISTQPDGQERGKPKSLSTIKPKSHWSSYAMLGLALFTGGMLVLENGLPYDMRPGHEFIEPLSHLFFMALNAWIFWQFIAWVLRHSTPQPLASSPASARGISATAPVSVAMAPPRSPWRVLGWFLVAFCGFVVLLTLGFAVALIVPWMAMSSAPQATVVIRFPGAENVASVSIDGIRANLSPGGPNEWTLKTLPGPHTVYVGFDSDDALNQERYYITTINTTAGQATVVDAQPIVRSLMRDNSLTGGEYGSSSSMGSSMMAGSDQASLPGMSSAMGPSMAVTEDATRQLPLPAASASIPLADAVEVLTEIEKLPVADSLIGLLGSEPKVQVWIDEPGLLIRLQLRQFDFEGTEKSGPEFRSIPAWGTGAFAHAAGGVTDLQPGRYRVLVQDLEYGWDLDRRGTIVIGNGTQMIHVKRSFAGQQLLNPGPFPVAFRWAGKTYQIQTPEEVKLVDHLLGLIRQDDGQGTIAQDSPQFAALQTFRDSKFMTDAIEIDPSSGAARLKWDRSTVKLDFQSPVPGVRFETSLGSLQWGRSVPEGFHVPANETKVRVFDPGFSWWGNPGFSWWGNQNSLPFDPAQYATEPFVVRLTRRSIKEAANRDFQEFIKGEVPLYWFNDHSTVPTKSVPAVRRLVIAWADGQPDVPETELLSLGGAASFEGLWTLPAHQVTQTPDPEQHMKTLLLPGSTPGTWRMKEPPAGAVADEVPAP